MTATLCVPTIAYLPFNFFSWLPPPPLISLIFGWLNITIHPLQSEMYACLKEELYLSGNRSE